jgi:transposase-like protein
VKAAVIVMKLKLVSLSRNSMSFMKTEDLLPCSHEAGIKTYLEFTNPVHAFAPQNRLLPLVGKIMM